MEGKSCEAIATERGENPIDMVCHLLAEENLAVTMISFYGSDAVLEKVLSHPHATVGSDGIYGGKPHPRLYGAYPRFIEQFVRKKEVFPLPEAIRKITSFPAKILGITDRGVIQEGNWADLVLFESSTIRDKATYEDPEHYPEGISFVFVNGELVLDKGGATGNYPGKVLRK
jgi:N-acyl-D-amino-acid deacylase